MNTQVKSGFIESGKAKLYYEEAGEGTPFVMIHAAVADHRQWNNEFATFAQQYHVIRYDMRGFGKSEPAEGEYSALGDLTALLDGLGIRQPAILMGCSMGGGTALDLTLEAPKRVKALIMVDSGPGGLELDAGEPESLAEAEKAYKAGEYERVVEFDAQGWFDGKRRTDQVSPEMRKLFCEMDRLALSHEVKGLGKRLPNLPTPAYKRLAEVSAPVLVIVGAQDTDYQLAAADYLMEHVEGAQKIVIDDAAHLPNMDHPEEFAKVVSTFLAKVK